MLLQTDRHTSNGEPFKSLLECSPLSPKLYIYFFCLYPLGYIILCKIALIPDLGRFRLRSRNQTTIPTPIPESESESESFVVHFGGVGIGVGIVVIGIGIGVGIVVIGIGVGIRIRFHTFMYTYHLTFIQEVTPRKLKALSHRVRNTAR